MSEARRVWVVLPAGWQRRAVSHLAETAAALDPGGDYGRERDLELACALRAAIAVLEEAAIDKRCQCQWEAGDSPCRVHGENEEDGT